MTTLGGALAGRWLDQQLGTYPFILVAGFVLGVVLGGVIDWRLVDRFLKNMKDA